MSYTQDRLNWAYKHYASEIARHQQIEEVLIDLKLINSEAYIDFGTRSFENGKSIDNAYIRIGPRHIPGIAFGVNSKGLTMSVVDTTPTLGDVARLLLPKVGRFEKSFDGEHNLLRLTAEYRGVRLIIEDTPPNTCTVKCIEEEVEVPETVVPAHTEKKVRYELEGDCDPLLASGQHIGDAVVEELNQSDVSAPATESEAAHGS